MSEFRCDRYLDCVVDGTARAMQVAWSDRILRGKIELRYWARRSRALQLYHWLRPDTSLENYERQYRAAALQVIEPGDVVWDVGANLGLYTAVFAERVGPLGRVVAFEPAPACFARLEARTQTLSNAIALQVALSNEAGVLPMRIADDPLGVTHTLAGASANGRTVKVRVETGDSAFTAFRLTSPNAIKLDVEGFELEVLEGLDGALSAPECRAIFCEVHFGVLASRGMRGAPVDIVRTLRRHGFDVAWVDQSHIVATRPGARRKPATTPQHQS